jgi:hypothetical protein
LFPPSLDVYSTNTDKVKLYSLTITTPTACHHMTHKMPPLTPQPSFHRVRGGAVNVTQTLITSLEE